MILRYNLHMVQLHCNKKVIDYHMQHRRKDSLCTIVSYKRGDSQVQASGTLGERASENSQVQQVHLEETTVRLLVNEKADNSLRSIWEET
jgi:hypothetical protein